jgi:ppGpp synthetase/RelA/SpoT-type nucleotidyltranferase
MGDSVGLVEDFISRYTKEFDFYDQAARLAARKIEGTLQAAGIRCIVTSRAKSISRLRDKCRQRESRNGPYASIDSIFEDLVDLAGVRVALYFPAEHEQVDGIIVRMFDVYRRKEFPDPLEPRPGKRFTGYSAVHYRAQLKEAELSEAEKRYAIARIEIQVASVLMHAWAEVEHDLVYKPLSGGLSEQEYAILDQLNGLVISGEIALEQLQKAGEARVAASGREFSNHYELAAYLLSHMADRTEEPISEAGLGRVDLLFDFIVASNVNTPEELSAYLETVDSNVEIRPLAEQVIDALLSEEPDRYEIYNMLLEARRAAFFGSRPGDDNIFHSVGIFMARWIDLERLIRQLAIMRGVKRLTIPTTSQLMKLDILPEEMLFQFDQLRRMRNELVHGIEIPSAAELAEAAERLDAIRREIERRIERWGEDPGDSGALVS